MQIYAFLLDRKEKSENLVKLFDEVNKIRTNRRHVRIMFIFAAIIMISTPKNHAHLLSENKNW